MSTAAVLDALKKGDIEDACLRPLNYFYKGFRGRSYLHNTSHESVIHMGLRHGDGISAKLFWSCLEGVFKKRDFENRELRINVEPFSHWSFVDDTVLLSESAEHPQIMLEELNSESEVVG